jgi:VacB/RNase II family 3'-5' exoribonuclease
MNSNQKQDRFILQDIAHKAMLERGLLPDFSDAVLAEVNRLHGSIVESANIRDMRDFPWCSIDNDESRDLDQLTVAESLPADSVKILVAVADVDSLVKDGCAINEHARHNTTSVYTAAKIFPMLPEKISTDMTSLNFNQERLAIVIEMEVNTDGSISNPDIYRARVFNHAKLAYNRIAAWLTGNAPVPQAVSAVSGLEENLRIQDQAARRMKNLRHLQGALSLETIEARPVFDGEQVRDLEVQKKNRAKELIEDVMIAANGVSARFLTARKFPSIRRVVRTPKRWDRIAEIAQAHQYQLPAAPDSKALEDFLLKQKELDPLRFPDLSLAVVKLLGAGEYVAELPNEESSDHFGLAVKDYAHSTAPNRRYLDLVTQRLLKAAIENNPTPYDHDELGVLAAHSTRAEDSANKVERQVNKAAAALLIQSRVGEEFDAIVTGASPKGTWVRLLSIPVEGKVVSGSAGMDVGERVRVELVDTNIEMGFIDFKKVSSSGPV